MTPEQCARVGAGHRGLRKSPESKAKMSSSMKKVWERPHRRGMVPTGENSHRWRGGRRTNLDGYVQIRVGRGYIFEHRIVMAEMLGRPMLPTEQVHHRNGIKNDNRPENLELRTGPHGRGATNHCPTCSCEGD